jgi:hypothetical protein
MSGKFLLALTSAVILGFESCGTHDHILLSHNCDCLWQLVLVLYSLSTENTASSSSSIVAWACYLAMALVLLHASKAVA